MRPLFALFFVLACGPAREPEAPTAAELEKTAPVVPAKKEDPCEADVASAEAKYTVDRHAALLAQMDAVRCYKRQGQLSSGTRSEARTTR